MHWCRASSSASAARPRCAACTSAKSQDDQGHHGERRDAHPQSVRARSGSARDAVHRCSAFMTTAIVSRNDALPGEETHVSVDSTGFGFRLTRGRTLTLQMDYGTCSAPRMRSKRASSASTSAGRGLLVSMGRTVKMNANSNHFRLAIARPRSRARAAGARAVCWPARLATAAPRSPIRPVRRSSPARSPSSAPAISF